MSRNVIAGGAAQRAIAGLMSLALVSGGLVVPSVANAAEETGKAVCRSGMVAPSFGKKSSKEVTLDRDIYKAGDVVEVKITGLGDLTAKQNLRLTLDGALWPEDQSKGDGLELLDDAVALKIPTSKIENGEVIVRVVLPSVFEEGFRLGENAIAVQLNDDERPVEVKGVVFRANESGKAAGACGPENPNGDKPEPEDAPASDDSNQGNAEQPGNENQDDKSADQGDKDQDGKDQPGNNEQAGVEKPAGQDGKPADQDNKDQGTKPADQGGKDQSGKDQTGKDQGSQDQAGKPAGQDKPADQAGKDQSGKDQGTKPADQAGKDQTSKDQGTKPADQGGKDQGTKPSGQNKPADQADKDQAGKDQAGKDQSGKPADQPGKDQDGKNQGPQDPKDPKITPSTQFSQLSSVRGIVGSIFAVLGLTALFAGALGVMAKYNVIPANWIPQQLRHLSR